MKPFRDTKKPHIRIFELARSRDKADAAVTAGLMFQRCLESPECKTAYANAVRDVLAVYEAAGPSASAQRPSAPTSGPEGMQRVNACGSA